MCFFSAQAQVNCLKGTLAWVEISQAEAKADAIIMQYRSAT